MSFRSQLPGTIPVALVVASFTWTAGTGRTFASGTVTPEMRVRFSEARVWRQPAERGALVDLALALQERAELTGSAEDYDRAEIALDRAEELAPQDADTIVARASLYRSRHWFGRALAVAEAGAKRFPGHGGLLAASGDAAFELGDLDRAAGYYYELLRVDDSLGSRARAARLADARGDRSRAIAQLEAAIASTTPTPESLDAIAWCRAVLGELFLSEGDPGQARRQYDLGLEARPDHPLVLVHLAELETVGGADERAIALYRRVLRRGPEPAARLALAALLRRAGSESEAADLEREAVEFMERAVESGNDGYLRLLARVERDRGRLDRAEELALRDAAVRCYDRPDCGGQ